MDQTQKLLRTVAENAHTGVTACGQLLERTEDEKMRQELSRQQQEYQTFANDAEQSLSRMGLRPAEPGPMQKAGMWMGVQLNTMMDRTPSHIADIAIQGATMGVVTMTRERRELSEADENAQSLAARLITIQQDSIDRLKEFL